MSSPAKSFLMNGVKMPAPKYEYDTYEEEAEEAQENEEYEDNDDEQEDNDDDPTEEQYNYESNNEADEDIEEIALRALKADAAPPPMPTQFYNEFDSFLSKPPPKIAAGSDGRKPTNKSSGSSVVLPQVNGASGGVGEARKNSSVSSKIKSKVQASRAIAATEQRPFDPTLLQEAFAYADRLQREVGRDGDDDDDEPIGRGQRVPAKSGSAPQLSKPKQSSNNTTDISRLNPYERQQLARKQSSKKSNGNSSKRDKEGVVKRLRSKTATEAPAEDAFSNISAAGLEHSRSKGGLDYESLVENFQNGTTLNKLKAELAASKQSMADSENFMRQLSKEYSTKKKR